MPRLATRKLLSIRAAQYFIVFGASLGKRRELNEVGKRTQRRVVRGERRAGVAGGASVGSIRSEDSATQTRGKSQRGPSWFRVSNICLFSTDGCDRRFSGNPAVQLGREDILECGAIKHQAGEKQNKTRMQPSSPLPRPRHSRMSLRSSHVRLKRSGT